MIPANKTVEIYYLVDEFLKEYDAVIKSHSLEEGTPKKRRNGKFTMSNSENMTILILFHSSSFRNLKHFYIFIFVRAHMQKDFPHTASYNRFVELNERFGINALVFLLSMNALMLQHEKIMLRKRSLIETVNDQLKNICQVELDPPSLLPKFHYQSVIGFGRFLLLRQKTFNQHRCGDCTHLFPAGCLGRTRVL